jgi:cyanate lyase
MAILTKEQIRKINKTALAEKHGTSQSYVSEVLHGVKSTNTDKAKAIYKDAIGIVEVLEGKPVETAK